MYYYYTEQVTITISLHKEIQTKLCINYYNCYSYYIHTVWENNPTEQPTVVQYHYTNVQSLHKIFAQYTLLHT